MTNSGGTFLFLVLASLAGLLYFSSPAVAQHWRGQPLQDYGYWEERWVQDRWGNDKKESVYIPGLNDRLRDKEQDESHYTAVRKQFLDLHARLWQTQKNNVVEILNLTREDSKARCVDNFGNRISLTCKWTDSSGKVQQKTYQDLNTYLFKDHRPDQMKAYHELYDQPANGHSSADDSPRSSERASSAGPGSSTRQSSREEAYQRYLQRGHPETGRAGSYGVHRSYRKAAPDFGPQRRFPASQPSSGSVQRSYRSAVIQE